MRVLVLKHDEVVRLLSLPECMAALTEAFEALARGEVEQPDRMFLRPEGARGILGIMPCYRGDANAAFGLKTVGVFHGNVERGMDAHQGTVTLFSPETGETTALMNASAITAIRTGAASGVATRFMAREDAQRLALVGVGYQARTHLRAIREVRTLAEVRVVSRTRAHCELFAKEMAAECDFPVVVADDVEAAVKDCGIIVTATPASEPVLKSAWVAPGTHINAIGSFSPAKRELEGTLVARARMIADRRASILTESGDYVLAANEGLIGPGHVVGELPEVVTGRVEGRTSTEEITIFNSVGMAVEDLAAAQFLLHKATKSGQGTWIDI